VKPLFLRLWSGLFPNPQYYGWTIAWAGLLCATLSSPGQSFVLALYLDPLIDGTGLSRLELSSIYSAVTLLAALCLPAVGSLADRVPARTFLTAVVVLLACAMLLLAGAAGALTLALAWFLLRLLGQGAAGIGALTATSRWFLRLRGRALGMVSLGYAVGEMVFPAAVFLLVGALGWRTSLVVLAAAYLLVFAPLVAALVRDRRSSDGPLDGAAAAIRGDAGDGATFSAIRGDGGDGATFSAGAEASATLREALRTRVFWLALLCISLPSLYLTGAIFHQVAVFQSLGWDATLVPVAFAAFAACAGAATYGGGLLLERVPCRFGVATSLALGAAGFASTLLPLAPLPAALLYGALLGLASGAGIASDAVLWPAYFGTRAAGAIRGTVSAVRNGAAAGGAPLAALLYAASGGFHSTLLLFGALAGAGALLSLTLRPPALPGGGDRRGRGRAADLRAAI
jgi:hypothetical protein